MPCFLKETISKYLLMRLHIKQYAEGCLESYYQDPLIGQAIEEDYMRLVLTPFQLPEKAGSRYYNRVLSLPKTTYSLHIMPASVFVWI